MTGGLLELLGVVRTAQAQAARLIAGHEDPADRAQTRRDLPMTLNVIEHALANLQAWLEYDQARDVLTIHGKQYAGALFGTEGLGGQPGTLFGIVDKGAVTTVHPVPGFSCAARDVLAERQRQVEVEGWTPEHDDEHGTEEMAFAAACYVTADEGDAPPAIWPWDWNWWRPKDRRRNLVKAAALILAEMERLDRRATALILAEIERPDRRATAAAREGGAA